MLLLTADWYSSWILSHISNKHLLNFEFAFDSGASDLSKFYLIVSLTVL